MNKQQEKIINKAAELIDNGDFDRGIDLIAANDELLEHPYFMKKLIKKDELAKYNIKDSMNHFSCSVDELINDKWWVIGWIDKETNTVYIHKTDEWLAADVNNLKALL